MTVSIQALTAPIAALVLLTTQPGLLQPGQTEYELPASAWRVWESRKDSGESSVYSMFTKAEVGTSAPETSLHITCTGRRLDIFARTSATVVSEPSKRYRQNLVAVRLRHYDESVTKSYLFTPLEDHRGFYLYKAVVPQDGAKQGIERLLGHSKTRIEFEQKGGTTVTALFDLGGMQGLYSSLNQACRSGRSMGSIESRLVAKGDRPGPDAGQGAHGGEPDQRDPPVEPSSQPESTPADASSSATFSVFGLAMGLGLEEIARRIEGQPVPVREKAELYVLPGVPTPNPDFEFYLGLIPQETGLCEVRAVGQAINSDPGGTAIRHAFHNNVAMLQKLFGPYHLVESGPDDPEIELASWMSSLHEGDTQLLAEWSRARGSRLGKDLEKILLTVRAESDITARLILQITFSNFNSAQRPGEKAAQRPAGNSRGRKPTDNGRKEAISPEGATDTVLQQVL